MNTIVIYCSSAATPATTYSQQPHQSCRRRWWRISIPPTLHWSCLLYVTFFHQTGVVVDGGGGLMLSWTRGKIWEELLPQSKETGGASHLLPPCRSCYWWWWWLNVVVEFGRTLGRSSCHDPEKGVGVLELGFRLWRKAGVVTVSRGFRVLLFIYVCIHTY